jgi:hypothetical protein
MLTIVTAKIQRSFAETADHHTRRGHLPLKGFLE